MLGEKLRSLREAKGLLLTEVADKLDLDTSYLYRMESNQKPVNRIHLEKLAKIYQVAEDDLLPLWLGQKVIHIMNPEINIALAKKALKLVINNLSKDKNL